MQIAKIVGQNLKVARQNKGFTQEYTGKALSMSQPNYTRFERGILQLNYEQIITLCKLLDITPNDLFGF